MRTRTLTAALAASLVLPVQCAGSPGGRVLLVGSWHAEKGSYESIQATVDAARPGDWILFGPRARIACASEAFGPCSDGSARPVLGTLRALAEALHADSGALTGSSLARMTARYPALTAVSAPAPPAQPSMPDPCAGVPENPWCPRH